MNKKVIFIDRSIKSVDLFLKSISKYPILSQEEEYSLWERMQKGCEAARDRLINCNLRYVVTMAKKYLWSGIALEDLISTGAIGLTLAADRFDATRGYRFLSYAVWWVDAELKKAVTDHWPYEQMDSLDAPLDAYDNDGSDTLLGMIASSSEQAPDWALTYLTEMSAMKKYIKKSQFEEAAIIFEEVIKMKEIGLTLYDVAKKHNVTVNDIKRRMRRIRKDLQDNYLEAA